MNGTRWRACWRDLEWTGVLVAKWAEPRNWDVITGTRNYQRKASVLAQGTVGDYSCWSTGERKQTQFKAVQEEVERESSH